MTSADISMELRREIIDEALALAYGGLQNTIEVNKIAACMYAIETGEKLLDELEQAIVADAKSEYGRRRFQSESDILDAEHKSEEPKPALTKDEVKAKLLELSGKYDALDVAALMESMGYTRLSDVPAVKDQELLDKADAAVKELA